ncbi:hypothetical protein Q6313_27035, partial [Klebsiella pneumoniae]
MNNVVNMEMCQSPEDFPGDVSNPVFFESVPFGVLHKVCDGPSPTKLHNKPELVIMSWRALLNESTIVRGNIS